MESFVALLNFLPIYLSGTLHDLRAEAEKHGRKYKVRVDKT